MSYTNGNNR